MDTSQLEISAVIALRHQQRTSVLTLPLEHSATVGSSATANLNIPHPGLLPIEATFRWIDRLFVLECAPNSDGVFLNGKKISGRQELKAGDELTIADAQLVVGLTGQTVPYGRRALTHTDFLERLHEELARAKRTHRQTALLMLHSKPGEGANIVAAALEGFRAGDVIGIYAHDELEILLPDACDKIAEQVLKRLIESSGAREVVAGLAIAPLDGDHPERLLRAARRAVIAAQKMRAPLSRPTKQQTHPVEPISVDPVSRALVEQIRALSATEKSVLFIGEWSSGKSGFAHLLHKSSPHKDLPWKVVPCSTIHAASDVESIFASASSDAEKTVTTLSEGTLLLDEIEDLPPEYHTQLVELIKQHKKSLRILSTTRRDLFDAVERENFSKDLYALIAEAVVEVPPLRARPEDILPMAESFAQMFGIKPPLPWSAGALVRLRTYPWPGNVLELRNATERALAMARGGELLAEYFPSEIIQSGGDGGLREHVDSLERDTIARILAETNYNQTRTAKRLGISRRSLIYKLEKYGLKPPPGLTRPRAL